MVISDRRRPLCQEELHCLKHRVDSTSNSSMWLHQGQGSAAWLKYTHSWALYLEWRCLASHILLQNITAYDTNVLVMIKSYWNNWQSKYDWNITTLLKRRIYIIPVRTRKLILRLSTITVINLEAILFAYHKETIAVKFFQGLKVAKVR